MTLREQARKWRKLATDKTFTLGYREGHEDCARELDALADEMEAKVIDNSLMHARWRTWIRLALIGEKGEK